jgi:CheY-like chemotaxis protein
VTGERHDDVDVLLVEDDPADAFMIRESFAQARKHARFHTVPDGEQAWRFLRQTCEFADSPRPGLILLDLHLPGSHGLDILAKLKTDPELRSIPTVVLSASQDPKDIERAYDLHANAYITKPADFDGFSNVIHQIDACFLGLIQPPP